MNPSGDANGFFGIKVSQPNINVTTASPNELVMSDDYSTRIYYSSTGVPTVLLGLRSPNTNNGLAIGEQGLYVSQSGIDVTQATDSQLVFNSQQDVFKIVIQSTATVTLPTSTVGANNTFTTTIPHGLNFIPAYLGYLSGVPSGFDAEFSISGFQQLPFTFYSYSGGAYVGSMIAYMATDNENIYFNISLASQITSGNAGVFSGNYTFTYYILQETI